MVGAHRVCSTYTKISNVKVVVKCHWWWRAVISKSLCQEEKWYSSNDNGIYSIDNFIDLIPYSVAFVKTQRYKIDSIILFQDNYITMTLTKNGRA